MTFHSLSSNLVPARIQHYFVVITIIVRRKIENLMGENLTRHFLSSVWQHVINRGLEVFKVESTSPGDLPLGGTRSREHHYKTNILGSNAGNI